MTQQAALFETAGVDWVRGPRLFRRVFPLKIPSTNHLYRTSVILRKGVTFNQVLVAVRKGEPLWKIIGRICMTTRHLTKDGKAFAKRLEALLLRSGLRPILLDERSPVEVILYVHGAWWTKDGRIRKADVANREKLLVDTTFSFMKWDDSRIFVLTLVKVQDEADGMTLVVNRLVPPGEGPRGTV